MQPVHPPVQPVQATVQTGTTTGDGVRAREADGVMVRGPVGPLMGLAGVLVSDSVRDPVQGLDPGMVVEVVVHTVVGTVPELVLEIQVVLGPVEEVVVIQHRFLETETAMVDLLARKNNHSVFACYVDDECFMIYISKPFIIFSFVCICIICVLSLLLCLK